MCILLILLHMLILIKLNSNFTLASDFTFDFIFEFVKPTLLILSYTSVLIRLALNFLGGFRTN